jgi:hypothetical protein
MVVQVVQVVHQQMAAQLAQLHLQGKEMQVHFQVSHLDHQAVAVVHPAAVAA